MFPQAYLKSGEELNEDVRWDKETIPAADQETLLSSDSWSELSVEISIWTFNGVMDFWLNEWGRASVCVTLLKTTYLRDSFSLHESENLKQ